MSESSAPPPAPSRRNLLQWLSIGLGAVAAVLIGVPIIGYLVGALRKPREDVWISLGPVGAFPPNETRLVAFANPLRQPWDGMTASTAAYVRRLGEQKQQQFEVFAVNCTHLGCPVSWFPQSGLFMCPCHGGVYYENGARASGPPPRGLYKYNWKVEYGQLKIQGGHLPTLHDTFKHPEDV
jgi:Rieske Fe-S protein